MDYRLGWCRAHPHLIRTPVSGNLVNNRRSIVMNKLIVPVFLLLGFILSLAPGLSSQAEAEPVVVIVNPSTRLSNISKRDLKKVFLGKTGEINGTAVTTVKSKGEATYGKFRKKVLGFSKKKEKTYWLKEIMRGRVRVVKQVDSDQAVAEKVSSDSSGIGIVSKSAYERARSQGLNVKALKINGSGPDSSVYLLN